MTNETPILSATDHPVLVGAADYPLILRGINRRRFMQLGAATAAVLAWPFRAFPFSQSVLGIHKFHVTLPGLGVEGANALAPGVTGNGAGVGNFIPLAPSTMEGTTQVVRLTATDYVQKVHPDIPPTRFIGYADAAHIADSTPKYLGGVIVATRGTPVRLEMTNALPRAHILPVDPTLIDPIAAAETGSRQDRIAVHLHGGFVFWDSDGGPFSWYSSAAGGNGGFVKGSSFINGGAGVGIYNYPNHQVSRLLWYHDHAYSLTRTNAYGGLASAYLITDSDEITLMNTTLGMPLNPIPNVAHLGVPLIIQDKTFWDGNTTTGQDPTYGRVVPAGAGPGSLWYPHVYEGAADSDGLPEMVLPVDPAAPGGSGEGSPIVPTARWGASPVGQAPPVSTVAEYFSDTILVNGAPYPVFQVPNGRVRFRILNGSNSRFYNLQLYVADTTLDGITLVKDASLPVDPNGNEIIRPDATLNPPGPAFIQIGNEAGFLPAPVVFSPDGTNHNSNRVLSFMAAPSGRAGHRRADAGTPKVVGGHRVQLALLPNDPRVANAADWNLLLAPAERADVIIDFRAPNGSPSNAGKSFILYNDAPGPFPGGDIRNDYFSINQGTLNTDMRALGGPAPTEAGFGPDSRVLMKFVVADTGPTPEMNFATTVSTLETELDRLFTARSPTWDPPTTISGATTIKVLAEDFDEFGRLRQVLGDEAAITGRSYLETPTEVATPGQVQQWDIYNTTADTHPMHFHLVNVLVKGRRPYRINADGSPFIPLQPAIDTGTGQPVAPEPPDPNEAGWKETVRMNPGEITSVVMRFDLPTTGTPPEGSPRLARTYGIQNASEYVWHCHILEHEEHDMMRPVVVMGLGGAPARKSPAK